MTSSETLASVCDLLGEYCVRLDSGRFGGWTDLFLADGRLEMKRQTVNGREQLLDFARNAPRGVHLCGLPVVFEGADAISSTCPWHFVDFATGAQFLTRRIEMHFPPRASSTSSP